MQMMFQSGRRNRGFTLIELLIVIAIIAILAVVVVLVLNPAQLLEQSRDTNRVSDLSTLTSALNIYQVDGGMSLGNASTVYVSIPDSSPTCAGLGLPALPDGWSYACAPSSTYRDPNGTGWIPVDFTKIASGNPLGDLPVDPSNNTSSCLYYTYTVSGSSFEITAAAESQKEKNALADATGTYPDIFTMGSNYSIEPIDYAQACQSGSSGGTNDANVVADQTAAVTQAGASTTITFSLNSGQQFTMNFTNDTYPGSLCGYYYRPDGSNIDWNCSSASTQSWGPYGANETGTYKLVLQPPANSTGSVDVYIYTLNSQTIALSSQSVISSADTAEAQNINLTFPMSSGPQFVVNFTSNTYGGNVCGFYYRPGGSNIDWNCSGGSGSWGPYSANESGTYTLQLRPPVNSTGSVTVYVYTLQTYPMSLGSVYVASSSNQEAQDMNLTFPMSSGPQFVVNFTNNTYGASVCGFYYRPSGSNIDWNCSGGNGSWGPYSANESGTYTLQLRPPATSPSGTVSVYVYTLQTYPLTIGSPYTLSFATSTEAQDTNLTYSLNAGQQFTVNFSNNTAGSVCGFYYRPDGSNIDWNCSGGSGSWGPYSANETGTYTLQIRPPETSKGSVDVKVSVP